MRLLSWRKKFERAPSALRPLRAEQLETRCLLSTTTSAMLLETAIALNVAQPLQGDGSVDRPPTAAPSDTAAQPNTGGDSEAVSGNQAIPTHEPADALSEPTLPPSDSTETPSPTNGVSSLPSGTTNGDSGQPNGTTNGDSGQSNGATSGDSGQPNGTTNGDSGQPNGTTNGDSGQPSGTTNGDSGQPSGTTNGDSGQLSGTAGVSSDPTAVAAVVAVTSAAQDSPAITNESPLQSAAGDGPAAISEATQPGAADQSGVQQSKADQSKVEQTTAEQHNAEQSSAQRSNVDTSVSKTTPRDASSTGSSGADASGGADSTTERHGPDSTTAAPHADASGMGEKAGGDTSKSGEAVESLAAARAASSSAIAAAVHPNPNGEIDLRSVGQSEASSGTTPAQPQRLANPEGVVAWDRALTALIHDNQLPSGAQSSGLEWRDPTAEVGPAVFPWLGMRLPAPIVANLLEHGGGIAREIVVSSATSQLLEDAGGLALKVGHSVSTPGSVDAGAAGSTATRGSKPGSKVRRYDAPPDSVSDDTQPALDYSQFPTPAQPNGNLPLPGQAGHLEEDRQQRVRLEAELADVKEQLARQTRLATLGQLAATIAHDLRNPLAVVRNAAWLLKKYLPTGDPKPQRYLSDITAELEGANRIISNLMESVRGKEPVKQPVNLGQVAAEVFDRLQNRGETRCDIQCQGDSFVVDADPVQLRQVLANLMGNAVEAMGGRGEIHIQAWQDGAFDSILVRDSGAGIPAEIRDTLFEPLVSTRAKGTGLGLAICRQIIERHGGTIELMPPDAEGGAAFLIRLPHGSGSLEAS